MPITNTTSFRAPHDLIFSCTEEFIGCSPRYLKLIPSYASRSVLYIHHTRAICVRPIGTRLRATDQHQTIRCYRVV
jgi:hypothetical protein